MNTIFRRPKSSLAISLAGLVLTALSAHALDNAGFETPDQGAGGFAYTPGGADWTFSSGAGLSGPSGPWKCNSTSPDPLGDQFGYLQNAASISQDMTGLIVGATYEISFYESYRTAYQADNDLSVIIDEGLGSVDTIYNNPAVTNTTWELRTTSQFVATATTQSLTFRTTAPVAGGDRTVIIDGVTVTTISVPGAPELSTLSPADDAGAVPTWSDLVVTFNKPVFAATGNITIKNLDTASDTVIPILDGQVTISGDTLTIDPSALLAELTNFAVVIDAGAVEDSENTAFGGIADDGSWTFTTAATDVAAPLAGSLSPADDAVDVAVTSDLVITFDEGVQKGTGNIVIKRSSDDSVVETIDVTTAAVTISGAEVTINPTVTLDPGRRHYVEVDSGALQDYTGNPFAGLTGASAWDFLASAIHFVPITGDADSGIDSANTYTHAMDFGNNGAFPVATINGVTFANGGTGPFPADPGASHTVGAGNSSIPASHAGNGTANPFLVDGGMEALVGDMIYNDATAEITISGLTSGQPYRFRLYHRPWGIGGVRAQTISFETDGLAGAEHVGAFNEDDATEPDPRFATATQVYALTYDYTLPAGQTTLTVNINQVNGGTYHLYGLTNEKIADTLAPELIAVDPADDTTDVLTYANLTATFSEGIALGTGNITLKNLTDATDTVIAVPDPRVSVAGNVLTIAPDINLAGNKDFAVVIDSGAVTDIAGNPFGGIANDGSWTFTTGVGDFAAPTAVTLSPADDEGNAPRIDNLVVSFDEPIQKGTGDIVIKLSSDDSVVETIDVTSGAVTVGGMDLTIDPSVVLAPITGYYVEIAATAVEDLYGNAFAGIAGATNWNFTTTIANDITYVGITGDADSGISSSKTYTHTLDFGQGTPGAFVNGVQFDAYNNAASGTLDFARAIASGASSDHPGNGNHNVTGGLVTLMTDMLYNGGNAAGGTTTWTLSGLTGGETYDLRIYSRQWGPSANRVVTLVFDPDGAGPMGDPTSVISQDEATSVGLPADNDAYYINYRFTAVEGEDLVITAIQENLNNSWHLYGITNEVSGSGDDYGTWASDYPGADLTDPDADFDGDGLGNDAERLFGLDPTDPASFNPIAVPLDPAGGTLSFTRRSQALTGMTYTVWTSTDLQVWTPDTGAVLTPGAPVNDVETVAVTLGASPVDGRLFVQIRAGLLFSEDFEADDGGFTMANKGTGTDWAWGAPNSGDQGGGQVIAGNGGSTNCWGTNLTGGYGAGTDTCLRSRVIDLTGVTGATLSFAGSIDADSGHTFEVNMINATTDEVIAILIPATGDDAQTTSPWQPVGPIPLPAAAFTQPFRIEWRFTGNGDGGFNGVYLDDVVLMESPSI